jgi:hypothetical protein
MAKAIVNVRVYYVLPCCLLLLNLVNAVVGYLAEGVADPWLRTTVVVALVLFGGSVTAFLIAPGLEGFVRWLQRTSRAQAGGVGEACFLLVLGALVFWLYYLMVNHGVESLVPPAWRRV